MAAEAKPGQTVEQERKARGMDVDRIPDAQIKDEDGNTIKVIEVERFPNSQRVKQKQKDYEKNCIECEIRPIRKQ